MEHAAANFSVAAALADVGRSDSGMDASDRRATRAFRSDFEATNAPATLQ